MTEDNSYPELEGSIVEIKDALGHKIGEGRLGSDGKIRGVLNDGSKYISPMIGSFGFAGYNPTKFTDDGRFCLVHPGKALVWGEQFGWVCPECALKLAFTKQQIDGLFPEGFVPMPEPEEYQRPAMHPITGPAWETLPTDNKPTKEPGVVIGYDFEKIIPESEWKIGSPEDYQAKAKSVVVNHIDSLYVHQPAPAYEVYVVWFCKTLQNWKALLSTTLPDGMYYEVAYNGDKHETYLDIYSKLENIVIPD